MDIDNVSLHMDEHIFDIKPGAFFRKKVVYAGGRGVGQKPSEMHRAIFVYDVFEKQNKTKNTIWCRYLRITWYINQWQKAERAYVSDLSGRVDGKLKQELWGIVEGSSWEQNRSDIKVEFSTDVQDLDLVVQTGKTVRQLVAESFAKQHKRVKNELIKVERELEIYDSVGELIEGM